MDVGIKILQDNYKKEKDPYIRERILIVIELRRGGIHSLCSQEVWFFTE